MSEEASLTLRRWGSRISAKIQSWTVLPAEAKLRGGLLIGDEVLVMEALYPRTRTCTGTRTRRSQVAAELSKGFQDDTLNGFESYALDYLLQGVWSSSIGSVFSLRRAKNSAERRAKLLKGLCKDPVYGQTLQRQLENVSFSMLPSEDPEETCIELMVPSPLHRAATLAGSEVLEALVEALQWNSWRVVVGFDAPERDDVYMPSSDLNKCRDFCVRHGFGGFLLLGSYAYFRRAVSFSSLQPSRGELHLAPGPTQLSPRAVAVLLLGQVEDATAMDVALRSGRADVIRALGRMGCGFGAEVAAEKRLLEMILYGGLPHWLARTVGTLAHHGSLADDGTVLENPEQIRSHTQKEVGQVESATGLSAPVAALLLRHFGHPNVAIEEFRVDPEKALRAAQVQPSERLLGPCGICFEQSVGELQKWLPCAGMHPFCDACLRHYFEGLLESGNVSGIACPEPTCRLPLDEKAVQGILGSAARAKFVRLAAARDVDAAGHIAWCPQPGCGKAVARPQGGSTVRCRCGYRFCCGCKLPEGHEPCSCEQWAAWNRAHPRLEISRKERNKQQDRNEAWILRNAQHCPGCQGVVQRTGGCNHMVCRCGVHFCYVCGRPWEEHHAQLGGIDYFACRLPKVRRQREAHDPHQDPLAEFQLMERNVAGARRWAEEASGLFQACHQIQLLPWPSSSSSSSHVLREEKLPSALRDAVEVLVSAQKTMQFCFVFRWHAKTEERGTGPLEFWLGEFETACSTLEAALGPSFEAAWQGQSWSARENRWTLLESPSRDLHEVASRLQALDLSLDDVTRLVDSVRRLEARLLSGARAGRFYGEPPGVLARFGQKVLSWLGW